MKTYNVLVEPIWHSQEPSEVQDEIAGGRDRTRFEFEEDQRASQRAALEVHRQQLYAQYLEALRAAETSQAETGEPSGFPTPYPANIHPTFGYYISQFGPHPTSVTLAGRMCVGLGRRAGRLAVEAGLGSWREQCCAGRRGGRRGGRR